MKPPASGEELRWAGEGDAGTLVTVNAERLFVVAARATRLISTGLHRMHRQEIVRVDAARPDAPVVAFGAVAFFVTARAELALVGRDFLVPLDPVGAVPGVVEPGGWHELATRIARAQERAFLG
jgi:hypothetical protein